VPSGAEGGFSAWWQPPHCVDGASGKKARASLHLRLENKAFHPRKCSKALLLNLSGSFPHR
jgi:hypothetical protein